MHLSGLSINPLLRMREIGLSGKNEKPPPLNAEGPTPTPQQGAASTLSPFCNFVVVRGTTPCKAFAALAT